MRLLLSGAFVLSLSAAQGQEISSVYTDLDTEKDCTLFSASEEGESASFACNGFGGYPVLIFSGDLRETVQYGFTPPGEPAWESFLAFNAAGPKIEWRILRQGEVSLPFAAIQRRFISEDPEDPEKKTEVLVVSKVGQFDQRESCAVGLVLATGNPQANATARRIADEQARDFKCGGDERVLVGDPMPVFERVETGEAEPAAQ